VKSRRPRGTGYDCIEFNTFDIELFYGENRVKVRRRLRSATTM
jgi:hypothetical protein